MLNTLMRGQIAGMQHAYNSLSIAQHRANRNAAPLLQ
jgi:hypothetical protein